MLKLLRSVGIALFLIGTATGAAYAATAMGTIQATQDNGVCTGVVSDVTGETVIGASVVVKGTVTGTITNLDGEFILSDVPVGSTIVFSFIGFQTQEVVWNGGSLNIVLKDDYELLEETVVVGYGTQKKANLTGAVAAVDGKVLEDRPITNIGQGLQGVVPNLVVTMNNGGAPGASSSFNIRGTNSLNGGSPLVLVDNVQMDPNLINPDDVESISVLKDAASASIYGARASYGVILITTKKGKTSEKPVVSFSATGYWQEPAMSFHTVNSMEYLTMMDGAYQNDGGSGHYFNQLVYDYAERYYNGTYDSPVFYDPSYDAAKYGYCGNTDWWDELYKTSFSQIYNVSVSGGSEKTTYYASVGVNSQGGTLKYGDDKYQRINTSLSVSTDVTKWLNVSAKLSYNYTTERHPSGGAVLGGSANSGISAYSGIFKNDLSPLMPVKHPDGNFAGQGNYTNPAAVLSLGGDSVYKQNDVWATGAIKITPVKGLVINADYTWNSYSQSTNEHVENYYDYTAVPGTENYYPWTNPSKVAISNTQNYYMAFNVFAEYSISTNNTDHNFKVMVGYNQERETSKYTEMQRSNLIDASNPSINLAYGDMGMDGSETVWAVNGIFARINYDYKGRYLIELNGRYDGSSKFSKGDRYAFFPSVSGAWRISEERFWDPIRGWWNNLKLRASYGSLGNQAVTSNFPYLATYGTNTAYGVLLGGSLPVAVTAPGLVSGSYTWETVNQVDAGFDASFLSGRLNASFDWYRRDTRNMLVAGASLPAVLGTSVPDVNAGNLKTCGWEVSISWEDRLQNGFSYHVKGVLSDYQSTITKYSNDTGIISDYYEGRKIGEIWGYVSNGLFQSDAEVAAHADQSYLGSGWAAGDVKYEDLNGDGKIDIGSNTLSDPGDRKIIGNETPRFQYGITAGFEYKGFDFEMFWQGVGKRDYAAGGGQFWGFTDEWCVPLTTSLDYWTEDNTDAYFPRLHHYFGGNQQTSTRYLQNARYIRLKNLVLGYTIHAKGLERAKISRLRVFIQGENLFTFTPLIKAFDPETLSNMTYPINRKYSVGVNLTF